MKLNMKTNSYCNLEGNLQPDNQQILL